MGTAMHAVTISAEEYLRTDFEPDADFVDGLIEERPMGEYNHSSWQEALLAWFGSTRGSGIFALGPNYASRWLPRGTGFPISPFLTAISRPSLC